MKEEQAIEIKQLSKKFIINHKLESDFRNSFSNNLLRLLQRKNKVKEEFWALKNLDLCVNKGETLGIIGRNGAGKSTLLKILSRITEPSSGRIEINGRVSSLLEVGTGFHMELTGRENIYLNGTILGMKRSEIRAKFDEIVEFSGVEKFIETPVKHYSSGMKVRLAFSVAAHLEPDVLIIDEVLAVGDSEFQKKSLGKMDEVSKKKGRTVLFVSHNMGAVSQLCKRGIVLDEGSLVFAGKSNEAISKYNSIVSSASVYSSNQIDKNKNFNILKVALNNRAGISSNIFPHDQTIQVEIEFLAKEKHRGINICFSINDVNQQVVFTSDVPLNNYYTNNKVNKALATIPSSTLTSGNYTLMVAIHNPTRGVGAIEYLPFICPFTIFDNGSHFAKYEGFWSVGSVFVNCDWEFN